VRTASIPLLLILSAVAGFAAGDVALLPRSGFLGDWSVEASPRVFSGSALYGHIDGGAEIFFEFGFEEATVQRYRSKAGEVVVDCYRMTDPVAALGIYLGRCGKETPDHAFGERHTLGRYQLMFVRDRYFVIIDNPGGAPALVPTLTQFARAIAARFPPSRTLNALDELPGQDLIEGSQRLIRGPVALEAIATLGRGDILQLGRRITAAAADYTGPDGKHTLVVVTYPDAKAAAAALGNLAANLDPEIDALARTDTRLVFRDYDGTFGTASVAGDHLEIQLHLQRQPALK
jgi:hypothetical protein